MKPESDNVYPTLVLNDSKYLLFKIAIYFAERGLNVWFISPIAFNDLPENIDPSEQTLQLITFVYLQDHKTLIKHLNATHLWHKNPRVIILAGFNRYTNLCEVTYQPLLAGLITKTLLDCATVCFKNNGQSTFLLVSTKDVPNYYKERLQMLCDMYFPNVIQNSDETLILHKIIDFYRDK